MTIRWVSPVRHFMRTATADTEVGGQKIKAGESMTSGIPSANRDEVGYSDPNTFRIDRKESKQIAFGFGAHVCLSQHLARMEMSSLFQKLLERVDHIELAENQSILRRSSWAGLKSLPIRYKMK